MQPEIERFKQKYYDYYFIGGMMNMLENLKKRLETQIKNLNSRIKKKEYTLKNVLMGSDFNLIVKEHLRVYNSSLEKTKNRLEAAEYILNLNKNVGWRPDSLLPEDHYGN